MTAPPLPPPTSAEAQWGQTAAFERLHGVAAAARFQTALRDRAVGGDCLVFKEGHGEIFWISRRSGGA